MSKLSILILQIFLIQFAKPECRQPSEYPVMLNDEFLCTAKYTGKSHGNNPVDGCIQCKSDQPVDGYWYGDNSDRDAGHGFNYAFGSAIVKPGCSIYLYKDENYSGDLTVLDSGSYYKLDGPWGDANKECADGWTSYKCRCQMSPIRCSPTDQWRDIVQCDNTESATTSECNYIKTIGTSYTSSVEESMHIDTTIEESFKESLFEIFEASIGVSVTTGYNWATASSKTFDKTETIEVKTTVDPGYIKIIRQVEAECDGNDSHADWFKIIDVEGKSGKIAKVTYESTFKDSKKMNELPKRNFKDGDFLTVDEPAHKNL